MTSSSFPFRHDLLDTLKAHQDSCVGMAANMIGMPISIIAVNENGKFLIMYDPHIIRFALPYETQESCLSVAGIHSCIRYDLIEVEYRDFRFIKKKIRPTKVKISEIVYIR